MPSIFPVRLEMIRAGAGAVHLEDQVAQKRCGHRPNKAIVSTDEMCDLETAADAKTDPDFIPVARTDALAVEGFSAVVERAQAFVEAGADAIFAEAMTDLSMYGGRRCGGRAGAGQHYDSDKRRSIAAKSSAPWASPWPSIPISLPGNEPGSAQCLSLRYRRGINGMSSRPCKPAWTSMISWAITNTKGSLTLFGDNAKESN